MSFYSPIQERELFNVFYRFKGQIFKLVKTFKNDFTKSTKEWTNLIRFVSYLKIPLNSNTKPLSVITHIHDLVINNNSLLTLTFTYKRGYWIVKTSHNKVKIKIQKIGRDDNRERKYICRWDDRPKNWFATSLSRS